MQPFDVAVVGAGLAGLHCARLLGGQGLRVLLVDRKPSPARSVRTTGIFVRRTLEDFDLPESCLGPPVRHVTLYSPSRRPLALASAYDEFRVGRMGRLYLHYLDECHRAGVVWAPGTSYVGCQEAGESLMLQLQTDHWLWSVHAQYLVGADGAASRVARDLGLDVNQEWIVGVEDVLRDVPLRGPPCLHCFLDPRLAPGYIAWLVHDGEETHLGVGGYAARFEPVQALQKFRASVQDRFLLGGMKPVERRGGRIPVGGVLRRIGNRRGLLVGDAAGAVSPLTAGGLDPCLRLSRLAARVIGDYLTTRDPAALACYAGRPFRSRLLSRLWMRRLIATVRQPALMELACAVLRLPPFRLLAWHVFFGRGSFPDAEKGDEWRKAYQLRVRARSNCQPDAVAPRGS